MTPPRIVVVVSGFPRRSETFALAELAALDRGDMLAAIFSTKPGEEGICQPAADALRGRVTLLSGYTAASHAADAARQLAGVPVAAVHGYFAHAPAAVAEDLARRLGVPFGFSAHARDARKVARHELHARAHRASCVIACNADVAREFDGSDAHVSIVPHGVDLRRFTARRRAPSPHFAMLAVGRLVEKKGLHVLVDAASRLDFPWRLRIVGDGPERDRLVARIQAAGIADRVTFCGPLTHEALPSEYQAADVVVVPSIRDATGDRDGLPNVVLEAMAAGTAIVASETGAIASAVRNAETGLLVRAGDAPGLARALTTLARDPDRRRRLGTAARALVERRFDAGRCTKQFASVLRDAYG